MAECDLKFIIIWFGSVGLGVAWCGKAYFGLDEMVRK